MPVFKTGAINHSATSPGYYSFTTVCSFFAAFGGAFPCFRWVAYVRGQRTVVFKTTCFNRSRIPPDSVQNNYSLQRWRSPIFVSGGSASLRQLLRVMYKTSLCNELCSCLRLWLAAFLPAPARRLPRNLETRRA